MPGEVVALRTPVKDSRFIIPRRPVKRKKAKRSKVKHNPTLGTNDRTFIMADQTLSSPVVISPNTSALDIRFSVTGASTFAFNDSDDIFENTFNGIVFLFSAN